MIIRKIKQHYKHADVFVVEVDFININNAIFKTISRPLEVANLLVYFLGFSNFW